MFTFRVCGQSSSDSAIRASIHWRMQWLLSHHGMKKGERVERERDEK